MFTSVSNVNTTLTGWLFPVNVRESMGAPFSGVKTQRELAGRPEQLKLMVPV
jgi:hypothetical protein